MMFKSIDLDNGLKVATVRMPHMESVSIGVWINAGVRNEGKSNNGISHLIEHLLFKGTKTRDAVCLKQEIEGRGGSFNGFTAEEFTCYLVKVLAKDVSFGMDVLGDMVLNPLLSEKDIAKEKQVIIEEINMYRDMPAHYIHELLTEILWPGHPLGFPLAGTVESVRSIVRKDVLGYKDIFYTPSNMAVAAVGNLEEESVSLLARRFFAKAKASVTPASPDISESRGSTNVLVHYKKTEQTHVAIGIHAPHRFHPDRYVVSLLNIILGANMSSRLFQEVRERLALCYEIGSSVRRYRDDAAFVISAGVDCEKLKKALSVILRELAKIKKSFVGADELKRAKEYYKGQLLLALEDTMSAMLWFGEKIVTDEKEFNVKAILSRIESITAADISRLANDLFHDANLSLAVIGPVKDKPGIEEVFRIR